MKVLVLGGTGAMGKHLINLLSSNGVQTVVTSRSNLKAEKNVRFVQGNAHDLEFIKSLINEKWDAIVDFMVYTTSSFSDRVNLFLNATSQYIFLSSARVYADSKMPISESSLRLLENSEDKDFLLTEEYALTKARQENILINSGFTNWTIIRPYITYGEMRLQLGVLEKEEWLYRALQGRTIVFSKDIFSKTTTLTYGLDVSRGIMSIIGNSAALGESFHITGRNSNSWSEVLEIYLLELESHLGYKPKVCLQELDDFFNWRPVKYQVIYDRLYNRVFNSDKIAKHIDVDGFEILQSGLSRCLKQFLKHPSFDRIDWKAEAIKDKYTGERASLNEIPGFKYKLSYLFYRYFF